MLLDITDSDISALDFLSPGFPFFIWYALGGKLVNFCDGIWCIDIYEDVEGLDVYSVI